MSRILLGGVMILALTALALLLRPAAMPEGDAASPPPPIRLAEAPPEVVPPPDSVTGGRLFDINVHTEEELELILQRVDALARGRDGQAPREPIALVLHGPEVAFFAARNHARYRDLVDLAAKLSAYELIDIRMCQTKMEELGIERGEIPPFIELVPYGPAESERLLQEGYVVM